MAKKVDLSDMKEVDFRSLKVGDLFYDSRKTLFMKTSIKGYAIDFTDVKHSSRYNAVSVSTGTLSNVKPEESVFV